MRLRMTALLAKDVLYVQRPGGDRALDDLLPAVDALIRHVVVGDLLECRDDLSAFIHGQGVKMPVRAFDHQLADRQGGHVRFGHGQARDVKLARRALGNDGGIGGQILDVRPVDMKRVRVFCSAVFSVCWGVYRYSARADSYTDHSHKLLSILP